MYISKIDFEFIEFDNGSRITYEHDQDCCESNYAQFNAIDDYAKSFDFPERPVFEFVPKAGFRFGDGQTMFFVPCYSAQNGYYSTDLTILFNGKEVGWLFCKPDFF